MKKIYLRSVYYVHMLAPLTFVAWHLGKLDVNTCLRLRALVGG